MNKIKSNSKILYISGSLNNDSPVGTRYKHFKKFLSANYNLKVINLIEKHWLFSKKNLFFNFINKLINKLPLIPDPYILLENKYKKAVRKIISQEKIDAIVISILPFSLLSQIKYIKAISKGENIIVDMSDPISCNSRFTYLNKRKKNKLLNLERNLNFADHLIVLNKEIKDYYLKTLDNKIGIEIIEQGIDENLKNINLSNELHNPIRFLYAGVFYDNIREPYCLYKAIQQTISNQCILSVYGSFKKKFIPPKSKQFHFGGHLSRERLLDVYKENDVIVFIDNLDALQIPGKLLEILALNKPILFIYHNYDSPSLQYLKGFEGIFITKNSPKEISKALKRIIDYQTSYFERNLSKYYWPNLLKKLDLFLLHTDSKKIY